MVIILFTLFKISIFLFNISHIDMDFPNSTFQNKKEKCKSPMTMD